MQKLLKTIILTVTLSFLFLSCQASIEDENGESVPITKIKLGEAKSWDSSTGKYDAKDHKVSLSKIYNAVYFETQNLKNDGKYIVIEYSDIVGDLRASVTYTDDTDTSYFMDVEKKRIFMLYNQSKTINSIRFQQVGKDNASVVIDQIGFIDTVILEKEPIVDSAAAVTFNSSISAIDFVKKMEVGFNLGNTFDARVNLNDGINSTTYWGQPEPTEDYLKKVSAANAKTIRIPVTWCNHIIDDEYTIDPFWMEKVKKVVDWAYKQGYYIILNEHHSVHDGMGKPLQYHEGYIIRNTPEDISESKAFLTAIWTQITEAFNNSYDEHLIFETMNEPRNTGHEEHMWIPALNTYIDASNCAECIADHKLNNEYNQMILNIIRQSGGNNAKRFVMIPSMSGGYDTALIDNFKMPADTTSDKLILTYHHYPLYDTLWTTNQAYLESSISESYSKINDKFVSKGIPVVVGEIGATATSHLEEIGIILTDDEALLTISYVAKTAAKYGMSVVIWPWEYTWKNVPFAAKVVDAWKAE